MPFGTDMRRDVYKTFFGLKNFGLIVRSPPKQRERKRNKEKTEKEKENKQIANRRRHSGNTFLTQIWVKMFLPICYSWGLYFLKKHAKTWGLTHIFDSWTTPFDGSRSSLGLVTVLCCSGARPLLNDTLARSSATKEEWLTMYERMLAQSDIMEVIWRCGHSSELLEEAGL